jgi:hypothetical protein
VDCGCCISVPDVCTQHASQRQDRANRSKIKTFDAGRNRAKCATAKGFEPLGGGCAPN